METLKKQSARWWPAWVAATRYVLLIQFGALATWLEVVTPRWGELNSLDWAKLAVGQFCLFLGTMGAVMNDKWQKARESQK